MLYYSHLDIKDIEEIPKADHFSGKFSDAFLESYPSLFSETYTQELFDYFSFFIHPYRRCFDTPSASPRNEEIESALKNKGKKGSCTFIRENNRKFVVKHLRDWMFHPHRHYKKHYYTSDRRRAMLYFDVDCHNAYQTPAMGKEARRIIEQECQSIFGVAPAFVASDRGQNGYLKVNIDGYAPEPANQVFDELQEAIRLLLAKHGNLADFEIKGTITWMDKEGIRGGRYGKLPMCSPDWSYAWFDSFRRSRTCTILELKTLIDQIKAKVTEEDVRRDEGDKHRAVLASYLPVGREQRWRLSAEFGSWWLDDYLWTYRKLEWVARSLLNDDLIEKLWPNYQPTVQEQEEKVEAEDRSEQVYFAAETQQEVEALAPKKKLLKTLGRLGEESDSYKRQHGALLVFARSLKRLPTVTEALDYIKQNGLFTGNWRQNESRRRGRVRNILKLIAKTFDPNKCSTRTVEAAKLQAWATTNAHKYEAWAKKKFPNGIVGGKKFVGEDGEITQQRLHVGPEFIGIFIAICDFGLLTDKNQDNSLPHERAKETWKALYKEGLVAVPFCDRKWAVCRDALDSYGIVNVIDRNYCSGKAMKWSVGRFFPGLGLWKTMKVPSLRPPGTLAEFAKMTGTKQQEEPNTLLRQQSVRTVEKSYLHPIRPPPTLLGA